MKKVFFLSTLCLFLSLHSNGQSPLRLWYKQPAKNWNEALPVGNGRLGAMIFGGVKEELIQLNESTLWTGGPINTNPNPGASTYLASVREALFKEDYPQAEQLTKKLQGNFTESYAPLGDIILRQSIDGEPTDYSRDLDISAAIASTHFKVNGVTYTREIFSSAADQVLVIHLKASKQGALNFTASTKSPFPFRVQTISPSEISMRGKSPSHADPSYINYNKNAVIFDDPQQCRGVRFALSVSVKSKDGKVTADTAGIRVQQATDVMLLLSAATSFNGFDKCPDKDGKDEVALAAGYLTKASVKNYDALFTSHRKDYQQYFNRLTFSLGGEKKSNLPIDERLQLYANGGSDPELEALYFQYGRYLLISSSRPGTPAANLQGIWNPIVRPPWSSNYTTNINAQMNYWPAEVSNLSELHTPFLDLIKNIAVTGKETAKNFYGAKGWALHHNSDIWATSNPVGDLGHGDPVWANWALGSPWVSQHLWEHYLFTGDKEYLKSTAYPLMKEAAVFCNDWLIPEKNGKLVTAPSTTPENVFVTDKGVKGEVSIATSMDMEIIWDLYTNVIDAAHILGIDEDFRNVIIEKRSNLFPLQIGKKGNIQEWYKDFEDVDPQHRHTSHLFGLHPGKQISPIQTPLYAAAATKTLELRGDGGTGWSKAWKINFWARLHDGNHAYKLLRELLKLSGSDKTDYSNLGGTYANLFCAHPPFQIDGNFGGTSGIAEMLLQSQDGALHIFPALPDAWSSGEIKGLKARGGFEVDMKWSNKKIEKLVVRSALGGNCRLRISQSLTPENGKLSDAKGKNPNPFYPVTELKDRTLLTERQPTPIAGVKEYDIAMEAGKTYAFKGM